MIPFKTQVRNRQQVPAHQSVRTQTKKQRQDWLICLTGHHHGMSSGSQLDQVSSHSSSANMVTPGCKKPQWSLAASNQAVYKPVGDVTAGWCLEIPFQHCNEEQYFLKQPGDIRTAVCQVRKGWKNFHHSLVSVAFHATQPRATQWLQGQTVSECEHTFKLLRLTALFDRRFVTSNLASRSSYKQSVTPFRNLSSFKVCTSLLCSLY